MWIQHFSHDFLFIFCEIYILTYSDLNLNVNMLINDVTGEADAFKSFFHKRIRKKTYAWKQNVP